MTEPRNSHSDEAAIAEAALGWLLRRQEGSPSAEEQARFQAWHEADPRHRAAYAEAAAMWRDAGALEQAFAPLGQAPANKQVADKQATDAVATAPRRRKRRWPIFAMASSLLAAACLLFFVAAPSLSHLPGRLLADHGTVAGEQSRVVLPDGSVALLNTESAIDVAYSGRRRVVTLLHGEAWFHVNKDPERPFDVVAAGGRTTAVGTAFAVRHENGGATITVTEGVVRVTSPDTEQASAQVPSLVEAGQQVSYARGAAPGPVRSIDVATATAWRHGSLVIRDRPLGEALAEIGRYRPGRLVLLGDGARQSPVTARLALVDIDGGIDALAATHGLSVTRVTNWLVIVR